ncbi:D-2-hydroxyacid dehydrogenase [Shewanella schlegeliana]|uniref:D-2-hydroxyacid dehydrogenase n=1 Tax=Shewanella schlegeliana TaxID=190308 RepID=A0ABS1SUW0_9GAMM|nr:D-2-hydroxyacid dehydrogenase [Shewanella schlegeliana]MBL4912342.1 D-2-hydroxyacid dehydrogenase [Shewanella schlegeliana]MCL1108189.1 D-2-hydroxyacid dehydrogenase [Shewanella schlegeliana]GIU22121.1 glycerate dehydrogenase [Shewanella schlegeliana]
MKIVVLDGYTLNPGDLDWQALIAFGELCVYERSAPEERLSRSLDAEVIFTNKTLLDAATLKQLPQLKYIGILATGTNVVDLEAAKELDIVVTNVPGYGPDAVAQMVFAHLLHATQQVALHSDAVKRGVWSESQDFCFTLTPLQSLKGKNLGLVGFGDIGKVVAQIGQAFGMKVLVNTRNPQAKLPHGCSWVDRESLFTQSDIVSLHCPLTPDTDKLINSAVLEKMKNSAILINTARGGLIDEQALADALNRGQLAFAGVDVLSTEPPAAGNPLLSANNISISPHNAWATIEARQNLLNIAIDNLSNFLLGQVSHQVN